jgi:hypothetical protein
MVKRCLGSYAFLWGWKFEQTLTWYGMFYPGGGRLEAVEAMSEKWNETFTGNRVPRIEKLHVSGNKVVNLKVTERVVVSTEATDRDGDNLTWEWLLNDYPMNSNPANHPSAIVSGQGSHQVTVEMMAKGKFLLYAVVRDGHGNMAYANQILICSLGNGGLKPYQIALIVVPSILFLSAIGVGIWCWCKKKQPTCGMICEPPPEPGDGDGDGPVR